MRAVNKKTLITLGVLITWIYLYFTVQRSLQRSSKLRCCASFSWVSNYLLFFWGNGFM